MPETTTLSGSPADATTRPQLHWMEGGVGCQALWRSERGAPAPRRVVLADDTLTADAAYRLACEGTALLWRGDFQNARQMLQAMGRRADQSAQQTKGRRRDKAAINLGAPGASGTSAEAAKGFHLHRQARAQRARVLGMLLVPLDADFAVALKRSPDTRAAGAQVWGVPQGVDSVTSLRELLGVTSAFEWRKNGVEVPALGLGPNNRIHPHYGVFSPLRGEYVDLVAQALLPLAPAGGLCAFDIGCGTGVLSAVLARGGVGRVVATDTDPRAIACAQENLHRLGVGGLPESVVQLEQTHLFPTGLAHLILCNPPWLPARPSSPIEHAVYDEGSAMLRGFLAGLAAHLEPEGEGWLILSDLAEHLGLRHRSELLDAIAAAGLEVVGRLDTVPGHRKAQDASDPLHAARSVEVTSLWRLRPPLPAKAEQPT